MRKSSPIVADLCNPITPIWGKKPTQAGPWVHPVTLQGSYNAPFQACRLFITSFPGDFLTQGSPGQVHRAPGLQVPGWALPHQMSPEKFLQKLLFLELALNKNPVQAAKSKEKQDNLEFKLII